MIATTATGADAIVLIAPADAGPAVDPTTYFHPNWVLWTPASVDTGSNRVLALLSGIDWTLPGHRGAPMRVGDAWSLPQAQNLERFGYFRARARREVVCLASPRSAVSPDALLLAATGTRAIRAWPWMKPFPANSLVVYEAHDWDEVSSIATRCFRTLVLEYPPRAGRDSSRGWIFERGRRIDLRDGQASLVIDQDVGIPGVFSARRALDVIANRLPTRSRSADRLEDANRWLEAMRVARPWVLGLFGALGAIGVVFAASAIMREKHSQWASSLLIMGFLFVPAVTLGCGLASRTSISGVAAFIVVIWLGASSLMIGPSAIAPERFETGRVIGSCATVAALMLALSTPSESILSGVFERLPYGFSPEAVGVFWAAVILQSAWMRPVWTVGVLVAVAGGGIILQGWWVHPDGALCLGVGLAVMQLDRVPTWLVIPLSLVGSYASPSVPVGQWSAHRFERFFISPAFWSTALLAAFTALFGDRFFIHQVRSILRQRESYRRIGRASLLALAFGMTHAEWTHAGLIAGLIGFGAILFACVRDL